jgi:membrane protein
MKQHFTQLRTRFTADRDRLISGISKRYPRLRYYSGITRETFIEWNRDGASRLAAALAYYTIFSLAPLLLILIAVAGFFFGQLRAREGLLHELEGLLGPSGMEYVRAMLDTTWEPTTGILATVIGVAVLLIGATGAFAQLQEALNIIWETPPRRGKGLWPLIRQRLLSFSLVLTIGFLLLVSLALSTALVAMGKFFSWLLPAYMFPVLYLVNTAFSFAVTTVLFASIYKILPDTKVRWRNVWLGAGMAALLFSIGRTLIGFYLGRSSFSSVYGAAGSFVVILFWVYYSAQILFFGAEFTQVTSRYEDEKRAAEAEALAAKKHKH